MSADVSDLNLNSDCVDNVPASSRVSMTIPDGVFNDISDPGMELSVVFTLYESPTLFPDENSNARMRVDTPVIGAIIEPSNTDSFSENVTIRVQFQLEDSVSFNFVYKCLWNVCVIITPYLFYPVQFHPMCLLRL